MAAAYPGRAKTSPAAFGAFGSAGGSSAVAGKPCCVAWLLSGLAPEDIFSLCSFLGFALPNDIDQASVLELVSGADPEMVLTWLRDYLQHLKTEARYDARAFLRSPAADSPDIFSGGRSGTVSPAASTVTTSTVRTTGPVAGDPAPWTLPNDAALTGGGGGAVGGAGSTAGGQGGVLRPKPVVAAPAPAPVPAPAPARVPVTAAGGAGGGGSTAVPAPAPSGAIGVGYDLSDVDPETRAAILAAMGEGFSGGVSAGGGPRVAADTMDEETRKAIAAAQADLDMDIPHPRAAPGSETVECSICMVDYEPTKCIVMGECDHFMCLPCALQAVRAEMIKPDAHSVHCSICNEAADAAPAPTPAGRPTLTRGDSMGPAVGKGYVSERSVRALHAWSNSPGVWLGATGASAATGGAAATAVPAITLPADVRPFTDEELARYMNMLVAASLREPGAHEKTIQCPNPRCAQLIISAANQTYAGEAQCYWCKTTFCVACTQPWHPKHEGKTCEELKQSIAAEAIMSELEGAVGGSFKPCPSCNNAISKFRGHGCHHVTCGKCKNQFCVVCMGTWPCSNNCGTFCSDSCDCADCDACTPTKSCTICSVRIGSGGTKSRPMPSNCCVCNGETPTEREARFKAQDRARQTKMTNERWCGPKKSRDGPPAPLLAGRKPPTTAAAGGAGATPSGAAARSRLAAPPTATTAAPPVTRGGPAAGSTGGAVVRNPFGMATAPRGMPAAATTDRAPGGLFGAGRTGGATTGGSTGGSSRTVTAGKPAVTTGGSGGTAAASSGGGGSEEVPHYDALASLGDLVHGISSLWGVFGSSSSSTATPASTTAAASTAAAAGESTTSATGTSAPATVPAGGAVRRRHEIVRGGMGGNADSGTGAPPTPL